MTFICHLIYYVIDFFFRDVMDMFVGVTWWSVDIGSYPNLVLLLCNSYCMQKKIQ